MDSDSGSSAPRSRNAGTAAHRAGSCCREGDAVAVVAGADARRGQNHALLVRRIRTDDGIEHPAAHYFGNSAGYLTPHPTP